MRGLGSEAMRARLASGVDPGRNAVRERIDALRRREHSGLALYAFAVAVVALAYYVAGRIGLELAYLNGAVAALWPPAGLGLAVLFLYGVRLWPAIVIGDLLLGDYSTPLGTVLAQTLGNTVALVVAALLLRRLTGGRGGLDRVADVLALFACALVAAVVSAAFGPLSLRLGDVIAADELGQVFRTWTLGDACGVLVVAPLILTWATAGLRGIHRRELVEGAVVLVLLVALAELAPQRDVPYVVFPVLLWAAVRFGPRGAATAVFVVCSITVWNTAQNDGPFLRDSITDSLLATQLFIAVSALTSLVLAAETAERTRAGEALAASEASQRALADEQAALRRVATLVASGAPPSRVFGQVTEEVARLLALPGANVDALRRRSNGDGRRRLERGRHADASLWPARSISTATPSSRRCFAAAARSAWTATRTRAGPRRDAAAFRLPGGGGGAGHRGWTAVGSAGRGDAVRRAAAGGRRAATVRLRGAGRAGARERRRPRAAGRLARAHRRGRGCRAPAARAQPARRRAAAAGSPRGRPDPDRREAREGSAGRPQDLDRCAGRARERARRAARAGARIHPAVLTDRGLGPALQGLVKRAPVPVEITELPEERLAGPVEAAAYYVVAEAITNVAKYAHASHVTSVSAARASAPRSRSPTTASGAQTPPTAPGCAGWRTAPRAAR